MITKEQCIPGTRCIVNHKRTKWNEDIGAHQNGLVCFLFDNRGVTLGDEMELLPGSVIEILSSPKRVAESGVQVKFKIEGSEKIMAAWWICIKSKIDIIKQSKNDCKRFN